MAHQLPARESELRALTPAAFPLNVVRADDPVRHAWLGAARVASDPSHLQSVLVSRAEYDEHGSTWLARHFSASELKR